MSASTEILVRELAELDPEELAHTFTEVLERTAAARWGVSVGVLVRALLTEDEHVDSLAGSPRRILGTDVVQADIRIRGAARAAVMSLDMYDSSSVGQLLGASGRNLREQASALRRSGVLLGLPAPRRAYVYPAFQFDVAQRCLNPVVAQVNAALDALGDPWGVGSWWASESIRLGGAAPWTLIRTDQQDDLLVLAGVSEPRPST